jgi:hypothetical protein
MFDKDTKNVTDGQKVDAPRTGLRASNTLETLRPREINVPAWTGLPGCEMGVDPADVIDTLPLQGRGLPPVGCATPYPQSFKDNLRPEQYNLLPVDWPTAAETMGFKEVERAYEVLQLPLETRVLRLEEQVDGLLDRLAAYNVKSSHKI